MEEYPSISRQIRRGLPVYAFNKIDGSNIRAEWTRRSGFNKFGSRGVLLDSSHDFLGEAPTLVANKFSSPLDAIFRKKRWNRVVCFFEFFGENSFAGIHEDESHDIVLIDVSPDRHGILQPSDFLKLFKGLDTPEMIYRGNISHDIEQQIRDSEMSGMSFEGVVCKASHAKRQIMFKVKTDAWLNKLRIFCRGDSKMFERLQ